MPPKARCFCAPKEMFSTHYQYFPCTDNNEPRKFFAPADEELDNTSTFTRHACIVSVQPRDRFRLQPHSNPSTAFSTPLLWAVQQVSNLLEEQQHQCCQNIPKQNAIRDSLRCSSWPPFGRQGIICGEEHATGQKHRANVHHVLATSKLRRCER